MTSELLSFEPKTKYDLKHETMLQIMFPGLEGEVHFAPPAPEGTRARCGIERGQPPLIVLTKRCPEHVRMHEMAHAALYYLVPAEQFDAAPDILHEIAALFIEATISPMPPSRCVESLKGVDLLAWASAMAAHGRGMEPIRVVELVMDGGFHETA